ncbi:MAG: PKD domain-containing protein [Chitinophagales bacterium]|nr:PKD domain-containing protein [Chitinophagales bacterium]
MKVVYSRLALLLLLLVQSVVYGQLNADFNTTTTSGCSPLVVNFMDASTGSPTAWRWDFGNGNTSVQQNAAAAYLSPGQYTVKLVVSNASGADSVVRTQLITVFQDPVANLRASDTIGCFPKSIQFTDLSVPGSAPIVSWIWDFGDGTTSTQQNPNHTYTGSGTYSVVLLIRDANGCTGRISLNNYIRISAQPTAAFTAAPTAACSAPLTVNFSNTSTGTNLSYDWSFGDGSTSNAQNPSHTYTSLGAYTVSLTVSAPGGCTNTLTRNNYITLANFNADFSVNRTTGCVGTNFNFTDLSSPGPSSWTWNFGDGGSSTSRNPSHSYSTPGTYTVTLTARNGGSCADTEVKTALITVTASPTVNFTADTTRACSTPFTVNFTNTSTSSAGSTYLWTFGDGGTSTDENPTHTYTATGNYTVRLTVTDGGCSQTRTRNNYIQITPPTAQFASSGRRGCIPLTVAFRDSSTSTYPTVAWEWTFGDGSTSTDQNPTHTYTATGDYDVSLVITNDRGCTDTLLIPQYVEAGEPPVVNFFGNPTSSCLFEPIDFIDSSSINGDQWFWDFGDGGTSFDQSPSYTYGDTGIFTVTLIVGDNGCYDTLIRDNYIQIFPPDARFDPVYNCADPYTVTFSNNSLGGHIWTWSFGDGDSSVDYSPTHTFAATGSYDVVLFVEDTIGGCIDSQSTRITITDPLADFSAPVLAGCQTFNASFSSAGSVDAASYIWDFGDGGFTSAQNPTHPYANTGTYTVSLIVTDIHGCSDTLVRPDYITVWGAVAYFSADTFTGCTPLTVAYSDSSYSIGGTINYWRWNLGNGDTSLLQNPSSTYSIPGNYTISLTVRDDNGCQGTLNRTNFIYPTYPFPAFTAPTTNVCLGSAASFTNNSVGSGLSYKWYFGDGDSSTLANPSHVYADTGRYTVSLFVTDINGCDSSIVRNNYIWVVEPHANFSMDTTWANCPPLQVNFTDLSTDSIVAWEYHFGDGQVARLKNPSHIYNRPGTFIPYLIVTNFAGCKDTVYTDTIEILGPTGTFNFTQPTVCAPFNIDFFAIGTNNVAQYVWDFGDGNVWVDDDTTAHLYTLAGTYNPVMILRDSMGCTISVPTPRPITATTITAGYTQGTTFLCERGSVSFTDQSIGSPAISTWSWNFGDGGTSSLRNPTHFYSTPGVYTVTLIIANASGCRDTIVKPNLVTVDPGPRAAFSMADSAVCFPEEIFFTDRSVSDSTIINWAWNFGDGRTDTRRNPSHIYTLPGTYNVTLIVTTTSGCKDTATLPVTIYALPVADAGSNQPLCIGSSLQLNASGGVSYQWSPATALSATNIANPMANPTVSTTYSVIVTDSNGCRSTDSMRITVNPLPTPVMSPDTFICLGASTPIRAAGGLSYAWSGAGLSSNNIANPIATPIVNTTYTVTVTDGNGCQNTGTTRVGIYPLPVVTTSNDTAVCIGQSANLSASGGIGYAWTPTLGLNNANIANPVTATTISTVYTVLVTDANGCQNRDSVSVRINPLPILTISPDTAICLNGNTQLQAGGGLSYFWSPSSYITRVDIADPFVYPISTTTYTVVVTDSNGCVNDTNVTITVHPLPVPVLSPDTAICIGGSAQLRASGGIGYIWSGANLSNRYIANPIATPTVTGYYSVTVIDANGCANSDSVLVTVNPLPSPVLSNDTAICFGETAQLQAAGGINYQWTPATGLNNANVANPLANPSTSTTYQVMITDGNGCVNTDTVHVHINPLPIPIISPDTAICFNGNAQLSAGGGVSYLWSPGTYITNVNIVNPFVYPVATTTYTVLVTDSNGCRQDTNVTVTVNPLPNPILSPDTAICIGNSVRLSASGGIAYVWSGAGLSNQYVANPIATPTATGYYAVTVTDANGCRNNDSLLITVNPLPVALVSPDTAICIGQSANLSARGGTSYVWSPASGLSNANIANPVASPTVTTVYTVQVTDANGCSNNASVRVTVNPLPVPTISADTAFCAGGNAQLRAGGGTSYQWSPTSYITNINIANPFVYPIATTTYTVTVTDANGCKNDTSVTVTVHPIPVPVVSNDTAICTGQSVTLQANGGASYQWSPAMGLSCTNCPNPVASPSTSTAYIVRVTSAFGCIAYDTVNVAVNNIRAFIGLSDTAACSPSIIFFNDLTLGSGQVATTTWYFGDGDTSHQANPSHVYTTPGNYQATLVATSNQGCIDSSSRNIVIHQVPVTAGSYDTTICMYQSIGLQASGGISYQWTPAIGLSDSSIANPTANPQDSTQYLVTVMDTNGCQKTDTVNVFVNPLPTVSIVAQQAICYGGSTQLQASGGGTYQWSPIAGLDSANIANPTASPDSSTTYTVLVTDTNGCQNSADINLTVYQLPGVKISADTAICSGGTANLYASGAASYLWSPANSLDCDTCALVAATPDSTTTYVVRYTTVHGCHLYDSVTVTVNALPAIVASNDTLVCLGQSIALSASGGSQYQWSPAYALACDTCAITLATPLVDTTYTIRVTTSAGCSASDTVNVIVHQIQAAFAQSDSVACSPADIKFDDLSTSQSTIGLWQWNFGDGSNSVVRNPIHQYDTTGLMPVSLAITDDLGCKDTAYSQVRLLQAPNANAGPDLAICAGANTILQGSGGGSYLWNLGNTLSDSTIANPVAHPSRTTTYILNVTAANGCTDRDTMILTVNALPAASIISPVTACEGDTLQLLASGGGTYSWTPAQVLSNATIANPLFIADTSRSFIVTVTNANGCTDTDSVYITINSLPNVVVKGNTDICLGESTQLQVDGGSSYLWLPSTGLTCSTCPNPLATPTQDITYVVLTSNGICTDHDTIHIAVHDIPTVNTIGNATICGGTDIALTTTASGADSYTWTNGSSLNDSTLMSPTASPSVDTWYRITASSAFGCEATDSVLIRVVDHISIRLSNDTSICAGNSVTLSAELLGDSSLANNITWGPANAFNDLHASTQTVSPEVSTDYYIVAGGGQCQPDTQTIRVNILPSPDVDLGTDRRVVPNTTLTLDASSSSSIAHYQWLPADSLECTDCPSITVRVTSPRAYVVNIMDENGCVASDTVAINIITSCEEDIFVPNLFTPNGDGKNDVLYVRGTALDAIKVFRIFDRWGNLVFETKDMNQGWNGTYNGSMVNDGVFVYYVEGTCGGSQALFIKGNVTVLR